MDFEIQFNKCNKFVQKTYTLYIKYTFKREKLRKFQSFNDIFHAFSLFYTGII